MNNERQTGAANGVKQNRTAPVLLINVYRKSFMLRAKTLNSAVVDCRVSNLQSYSGSEHLRPHVLADTLGKKYIQLKRLGVRNEDSPSSYIARVEPILARIAELSASGVSQMLIHWDTSVLKVLGTLLAKRSTEVVVSYEFPDSGEYDAPLRTLSDSEVYKVLRRYCRASEFERGFGSGPDASDLFRGV